MEHIDVVGSGFVPGIPGIWGNTKITQDGVAVPVLDIQADATPDMTPALIPVEPTPPSEETQQDTQPSSTPSASNGG